MDEHRSAEELYAENVDLRRRLQEAERALGEYMQRYDLLFQNAGEGIFLLAAEGEEAGTILAANPAMAQMHGYAVEEMLGMRFVNLDTPEVVRASVAAAKKVLRLRWAREEVQHSRKDGSTITVEMRGELVRFGDRSYYLGFNMDLTERKRAEETIRKYTSDIRPHI